MRDFTADFSITGNQSGKRCGKGRNWDRNHSTRQEPPQTPAVPGPDGRSRTTAPGHPAGLAGGTAVITQRAILEQKDKHQFYLNGCSKRTFPQSLAFKDTVCMTMMRAV